VTEQLNELTGERLAKRREKAKVAKEEREAREAEKKAKRQARSKEVFEQKLANKMARIKEERAKLEQGSSNGLRDRQEA
jgi:hypothetical protein